MNDFGQLSDELRGMEGRNYGAYKDLAGRRFRFGAVGEGVTFDLVVDYVQGDPFAGPSRMRVRVPHGVAGFPDWSREIEARRVGLESYLARAFGEACPKASSRLGSGKGGMLANDKPGQEVLKRTAVMVDDKAVEARFVIGLPARGRRAMGDAAETLICEVLPKLVGDALLYAVHEEAVVREHVEVNEDAEALRGMLDERELVGFVADGAVLPRKSGIDDRPMESDGCVRFESPESLRVQVDLPNGGEISGMGIPKGVTLIVGGGFHGKSTILAALERGIYNHRPGDGRELVSAGVDTVKIRAEDGRSVAGVDISNFINNLPGGQSTEEFSTENASGSTSQAANIMEALELGARVLLIDEDIAATNFMIRDARMQALVSADKEPITPFVDRVRELYEEQGVSSVLVIGGSGDYFGVADTVVMMDHYLPSDVTAEAKRIAGEAGVEERRELPVVKAATERRVAGEIDARKGKRDVSVRCRGWDTISVGSGDIDLSGVAQIVSESQTRGIAVALEGLIESGGLDGGTLREVVEGVDVLASGNRGDLAEFRKYELGAAINRIRGLRVSGR